MAGATPLTKAPGEQDPPVPTALGQLKPLMELQPFDFHLIPSHSSLASPWEFLLPKQLVLESWILGWKGP